MKTISLGGSSLQVPEIAVGCMRFSELGEKERISYVEYCMEHGLHFFDHADIYGGGECETVFGQAVKAAGINREDMIIQSKCGIVPGVMYDFSKDHILNSVDGILKRLDTEYLDCLVLHRPDALVEPEEVAEAFDTLEKAGKVRHFGVSNHRPMQIELLQKYVNQKLLVNQLQLSIAFSGMISSGLEVNMETAGGIDRDGGMIDYCRLHDITIQTWSPFQFGMFQGTFIGNNEKYRKLNDTLEGLGKKYGVTKTAIATAWILRHPAKMQMIAGTTKVSRMDEILNGSSVTLSRSDWYQLYLSAGKILP